MKFTQAQIGSIGRRAYLDAVDELKDDIYATIAKTANIALLDYTKDEALEIIRHAVLAAARHEIYDFGDVCKWCYLRLAIRLEFYNIPEFRYFLDEPLIHPKSKARNIVAAFHLAAMGKE